MRDLFAAFFAPGAAALRFSCKSLLGAGLALWFALRLGLEQPQWALMTALIVSQPLAGMVVQKGLARLVGTLIGASMALLIMAFAAQAPWLFLLCMALWVGICTAASTLLRSAWSYAFVLSGYTAALIAMPALADPLTVFDHAVARCTEIILGIVCATAMSAILWPQHVQTQLSQQARGVWQGALGIVRAAIASQAAGQHGLLELLGQIVAMDLQREHAWFEGHHGRRRARAVRALARALLRLVRIARSVARQRRELNTAQVAELQPWLEEVQALLECVDSQRLVALRERLLAEAGRLEHGDSLVYCLGRLVVLLDALEGAARVQQQVEQDRETEVLEGGFAVHRDPPLALAYGLRGALTFLTLSAFWLATGWSSAFSAIILATVVCGLFASRENPVQIGFSFLRGILLAIPVAFLCGQLLLPQWNGFPMLCLALGVPLFFGTLGMTRPAIAGTATSFSLHLIVLSLPPPGYEHDMLFFLNEALAMVLGVGCAVLAFRLLDLRNPRWQGRRLLLATLRDLARLTGCRLAGADTWFGGRMTDRLLQLARYYPSLPEANRQQWDDGLLGLDIGDELLHLRLCLAATQPAEPARVEQALREVERVLLKGPAKGREHALDEAAERLQEVLGGAGSGSPQRLGRAAVLQLQRSWSQWCELERESDHVLA